MTDFIARYFLIQCSILSYKQVYIFIKKKKESMYYSLNSQVIWYQMMFFFLCFFFQNSKLILDLLFIFLLIFLLLNMSTTISYTNFDMASNITPAQITHHSSDSHSVQITNVNLNGDNFTRWSQSVWMYICGCGKIDYLTSEKKAHKKDDLAYVTRDAKNFMIMSWLVNSMILWQLRVLCYCQRSPR